MQDNQLHSTRSLVTDHCTMGGECHKRTLVVSVYRYYYYYCWYLMICRPQLRNILLSSVAVQRTRLHKRHKRIRRKGLDHATHNNRHNIPIDINLLITHTHILHNNVNPPVYIFYTGTFFPLSQSSSHIPNTFHVQVHGFVPLNFIEHIPSIGSARDTRSEIQSLMATTGWLVPHPSPSLPPSTSADALIPYIYVSKGGVSGEWAQR